MKAVLICQIINMTAVMEQAGVRSSNWNMGFLLEQSEQLLEHLKNKLMTEYKFALMKLDLAELDVQGELNKRIENG